MDGTVFRQKSSTQNQITNFKNAYDRYYCKDMDNRSWSAAGPSTYKYKYKYMPTQRSGVVPTGEWVKIREYGKTAV